MGDEGLIAPTTSCTLSVTVVLCCEEAGPVAVAFEKMNHSDNTSNTPLNVVYERLTGINIGEQVSEWNARGKGYYGEFLLFSELYHHLPGSCKILMNLQIPSEHGKTTEIDLLLIHETGLYVFEAKHYKGTIIGKIEETHWTQYFRTAPNHSFSNPVLQNRWNIQQLRKHIPDLPIHSFIVFTSDECELKVTGELPDTTLCYLSNLRSKLKTIFANMQNQITPEKIDKIFCFLKRFSPIQEAPILYDAFTTIPFYEFVEKLINQHSQRLEILEQTAATRMQTLEHNYAKKEKALEERSKKTIKNAKFRSSFFCILFIIISIFISSVSLSNYKQEAKNAIAQMQQSQAELQKFKKKWEAVTDFEINGEQIRKDFVLVDQVELKNSGDFDNLVSLSCRLTYNGEDYYVLIDKSSLFTIVLKDGRVIEVPYFDTPYYSHSLGYSDVSKILEIKSREFSGVNAEDISIIKLTNLQVKRIKFVFNEPPALSDYEIILYSSK